MSHGRSLGSVLFRYMTAVFWLLCLGLGVAWVVGDTRHMRADMRQAETMYVEDQKAEVRALINNLAQYIDFHIDSATENQKILLRDRVYRATAAARHLYELNHEQMTRAELIELVREALRPLRYDDGSGYYFALDLQGIEILNADRPQIEGKDMMGQQDPEGRYVVAEILQLVQAQDEGFYSYLWTKPGETGAHHRKSSYVMMFEPLGIVIGTGQYYSDFIAGEQETILRWIRRIHFGEAGYVFVNTYDGTALAIRSDKYQPGDNIWELTDANGLKVIQEERRAVSTPGGDFISYVWREPGSDHSVRKSSFIQGIERWQWMIGAGVYLDDLDGVIAQKHEVMNGVILRAVLQVLVAFAVAFLISTFLARRFTGRIQQDLAILGSHFQDAVSKHQEIDPSGLAYTEFRGFAGSMNEMIVERRQIEEELLKARNLESIGVLAGGIAHDFNNLLTAILGNISLAREDLPPGHEAEVSLAHAENVSQRARDLTQQLLAFAKGGSPVRSLENLGTIVREAAGFSLLGSNVNLVLEIPEDLRHAEVDAGQFSQIIGNLTINANQAMPDGGTLSITAQNRDLESGNGLGLSAGPYVALEFRDSGIGIPPSELPRIFDPYFTTKESGTGLGLASVYAIIKNHDGEIRVESQVGHGTVFRLWVPAKPGVSHDVIEPEVQAVNVSGRVLVMDDDPAVSGVCGSMLKRLGCEVEYASNGEQALAIYEREKSAGSPFDLIIMDLTIRGGMGGREAIRQLLLRDPEARAIVSSGYSNDPVMSSFREYGFKAVIRKPYNLTELREALSCLLPHD